MNKDSNPKQYEVISANDLKDRLLASIHEDDPWDLDYTQITKQEAIDRLKTLKTDDK